MSALPTTTASPYSLTMLGRFRLARGIKPIELPDAIKRVIALLALADGPVERSAVAGRLWPDFSEVRARSNLRTALWRCPEASDVIISTRHHLALSSEVEVDLTHMLDQLAEASRHPEQEPPEECLDALSHDLLAGWDADWLDVVRERTRQRTFRLLDRLVEGRIDEGDPFGAIDLALRFIPLDPFREPTHAGLLRAYIAAGNRSAAVRHYSSFAERLMRELGLAPSEELTAIVRDLLGVPHPPGPRHRGGVGDVRVTHVRRERDEAADAMAARVARGFGER